jgi:hypothetical protein
MVTCHGCVVGQYSMSIDNHMLRNNACSQEKVEIQLQTWCVLEV